MAGDRGDDLAGVQRTPVSSSSGPSVAYARRTSGPAITGHGNGPLLSSRWHRRPDLAARHCDEGAALIAALASAPARPLGRSPAKPCVQRARRVAASPREGWPPEGARRWAVDSGSTRSAKPDPARRGHAQNKRVRKRCPQTSKNPPATTFFGRTSPALLNLSETRLRADRSSGSWAGPSRTASAPLH